MEGLTTDRWQHCLTRVLTDMFSQLHDATQPKEASHPSNSDYTVLRVFLLPCPRALKRLETQPREKALIVSLYSPQNSFKSKAKNSMMFETSSRTSERQQGSEGLVLGALEFGVQSLSLRPQAKGTELRSQFQRKASQNTTLYLRCSTESLHYPIATLVKTTVP